MKRAEFEHAVRAAASVVGLDELIVIGSQAVHGSMSALPPEAERSIEIDVAILDDDGRLADLIDGSIGEASMFHETFGYYAQGVTTATAVLPSGWEERLIRYETANTGGATALCLDLHDLWISKAVAHRPKDLEFCRALLRVQAVERRTLQDRLAATADIPDELRTSIEDLISG